VAIHPAAESLVGAIEAGGSVICEAAFLDFVKSHFIDYEFYASYNDTERRFHNLLSLRLWSSPDSTVDLWLELLMISES
jgi:hypothetical protein